MGLGGKLGGVSGGGGVTIEQTETLYVNEEGDELSGALTFVLGTESTDALKVKVTADAFDRWTIRPNAILGGDGASAPTSLLSRSHLAVGLVGSGHYARLGFETPAGAGPHPPEPGGTPVGLIRTGAADLPPLVLQAAASQSWALLDLRNSAGGTIANIGPAGQVRGGLGSAGSPTLAFTDPTLGNLNTGLYYDTTTGSGIGLVVTGYQPARLTTSGLRLDLDNSGIALSFGSAGDATMLRNANGHLQFNGRIRPSVFETYGTTPHAIAGSIVTGQLLTVYTGATTQVGVVVKGEASQTADLFQAQDSAGSVLARLFSNGAVEGTTLLVTSTGTPTLPGLRWTTDPDTGIYRAAVNQLGITTGGVARVIIFSGGVYVNPNLSSEVRVGANGPASEAGLVLGNAADTNLYRSAVDNLKTDDHFNVGKNLLAGSEVNTQHLARLTIYGGHAGTPVAVLRGFASQTANLQEWQNSAGGLLARIQSSGFFSNGSGSAVYTNFPADAWPAGAFGFNGPSSQIALVFGPGGASSFDTNLYRSAADVLKTDDAFHVGGIFSHLGASAGFFGATPVARDTGWAVTNHTPTRTFDAAQTTLNELANVVGTLIENAYKPLGLIGA